jgi:hypothetical protein
MILLDLVLKSIKFENQIIYMDGLILSKLFHSGYN